MQTKTVALPLKDGSTYIMEGWEIAKYQRDYPNIDVMLELLHMRDWLDEHPKRKKTRRGIGRFITGWLKRQYDAAAPRHGIRPPLGGKGVLIEPPRSNYQPGPEEQTAIERARRRHIAATKRMQQLKHGQSE